VLLADGTGEAAIPEALVFTIMELEPLNDALAPVDGAVKVTATPAIGFDNASVTFACNALPNAVPTVALCGLPACTVTDCAEPALLVKLKLAGVATPATEAVTL